MSTIELPSKEHALHFALMLQAGMPAVEAIRYFFADDAAADRAAQLWLHSRAVQAAVLTLQGKTWEALSLDERLKLAIDKHYNEMAYFLYSRNYVDLSGADRAKADTCRQALEAKLAGMAGKLDAVSRFWDDVRAGRVTLHPISSTGNGESGPQRLS